MARQTKQTEQAIHNGQAGQTKQTKRTIQAEQLKQSNNLDKPKTTDDIPRNIWRSFGYALCGIANVIATERNIKIHVVAAVVALVACAVLQCTPTEWLFVIVMVGLVISAELINSAIESVVNLVSPELHPLAKKAKDVAAGAVLILAIASVAVGLIIYIGAWMRLH